MSDHENVEIQKTDKASAIEQQQCFPSIPYVEWGFNSGLNNIMNMLRRGIVIRDPESVSSVNKLGMIYEGIPFDKGKRKLCDDSYLEQLPYSLSKTQHQNQCVLASTPRPPIAINHVSCSSGPPSCVPAVYSSGLASTRSFEKFVGCSTHTINRFTKGYTQKTVGIVNYSFWVRLHKSFYCCRLFCLLQLYILFMKR